MIEIKGISKSFDSKKVLKNIDLNLERGKVNMIIGKSGAGILNYFGLFYGWFVIFQIGCYLNLHWNLM